MKHISEPLAVVTATMLDQLITEKAAADFLGYSVRALQNWRVRGGGPKFVRVSGRSIRYRLRELNDWAESRLCSSTSQPLAPLS